MNGYRKGFSTQEALFPLIEIWKYTFDQNGYGGAILMDLWKAFDTINHDILIAKLVVYGFDAASLKINRNYLMNCFQRTKPNTNFSSWSLFNIYINDLLYLLDMADVVIMLMIQLSMLVTWILKILLQSWSMMRPLPTCFGVLWETN